MAGWGGVTSLPLGALVLIAFCLDLLVGDPPWLPHPVRAIAWLAQASENFWRWLMSGAESRLVGPPQGGVNSVEPRLLFKQRLAGVLTVLSVLAGVSGMVVGLLALAAWIHPWAVDLLTVYLLFASLATRDLARHSRQVQAALVAGDLPLARQRLAMIVGRETAKLDEAGVSRACVESVAENIVDGITAPLLWAALGGPLGAMLYKAINTMDSMFGYKNERYHEFGWAPARLDDLANYLPARLTAGLVIIAAALLGFSPRRAYQIWQRDRRCHASPNSAQTEAAVAGALGIQLAGPAVYFGSVVDKPTIGDAGQPITPRHIVSANRLLLLTASLGALLAGLCRLLVVF